MNARITTEHNNSMTSKAMRINMVIDVAANQCVKNADLKARVDHEAALENTENLVKTVNLAVLVQRETPGVMVPKEILGAMVQRVIPGALVRVGNKDAVVFKVRCLIIANTSVQNPNVDFKDVQAQKEKPVVKGAEECAVTKDHLGKMEEEANAYAGHKGFRAQMGAMEKKVRWGHKATQVKLVPKVKVVRKAIKEFGAKKGVEENKGTKAHRVTPKQDHRERLVEEDIKVHKACRGSEAKGLLECKESLAISP